MSDWPKHSDGTPKKMREMTREEQREQLKLVGAGLEDAMLINQAITLRRDEPVNNPEDQMNWRCDIWEADSVRSWPLFATAWGHTRTEAMSKANLIIAACAIDRETGI